MEQPAAADAAPSPLTRLPPQLLQHCFSFLDNDSRHAIDPKLGQAVLDVSRGWYAALAAAPALVPLARLSCLLDDPNEEHEPSLRQASRHGQVPCPQCDHAACAKLRTASAQLRRLSPRTLRVRLDGYDWHIDGSNVETSRGDHNLLVESLQLLPDGITALELNSFCTDGAMPALARFTALHQLELTGNAMEVDWARPAAQAVMPLLRTLCLLYINYETPPCLVGGYFYSFWDMPSSATSALTAASRLERLTLQVGCWTSDILTLWEALPALRDLSFDLQPVIPPDEYEAFETLRSDLPPAIAALHRLTRLTALSLSAGAALSGEALDGWYSWEAANARLPPLAGLSALTELRLSLFVPPPPDWQHLTSLCRLELRKAVDWEEKPLTSLCSLTHLGFHSKHHPEPSCLASLPCLATVHAPFASAEWRERLSALMPHVKFVDNA
ncbi:hypothetical protein COHA_004287 [Chlorella ohadii]|uniref:Uncharacterized protein n=1 Tax=Chlorella ohadii TaxID=2649997 RepID=A0AAD5H7C7_9CHLO|nr:hypothetical protein COHA_004287 [Chlorella ohadii]